MFIKADGSGGTKACIFGVSQMSDVDGPGKRAVIFFQGCAVGCAWCHSPHSQPQSSPLIFRERLCSLCGRCKAACNNGAHLFSNGRHIVKRTDCNKCGECVRQCPQSSEYNETGVLYLPTKCLSPGLLFEQIEPYLTLCDGITLSGGEALLQTEAALQFLSLCKEKNINVAVETSGLLSTAIYKQAVPLVDVWLFGMRIATRKGGPLDIEKILNAGKTLRKNSNAIIIPRLPLVPEIMEQPELLHATDKILRQLGLSEIWLNPWNESYDVYYLDAGMQLRFPRPSHYAVEQCRRVVSGFFADNGYKLING